MKYYIAENGQQVGPMEKEELLRHGLTVNTLVWCEGQTQWVPAGTVPDLAPLLGMAPQTPPIPQQPYQQPYYQQPYNQAVMPKTYLTEAILVTLFCCLPLGIVAIIKASGVSQAFNRGDYDGANRASQEAGKWVKWSFILGLVYLLISSAIVIFSMISDL